MASVKCADLTDKIRKEARRLGFIGAGIAPVGTLPYGEHFSGWLSKGMHGDMHYLERQASRRLNPALILPNARSIVVLALNYYSMMSNGKDPLKGRISRYAWGDDYHDAMRFRMEELLHFIQCQEPSIQGRCYVDTGPVMEKVWGAATCLGWMGRNTNLITRDHGSWFFLGVILLDTALEPDSREKDFCGQCNRCIKACPTGAIVAPYVLDARLCVSYLTIEHRGPIPRILRTRIGNRIYGCDDCQEACPWNRFAVSTIETGFNPRTGNHMPDLIRLLRISPGEFRERFRDSPIVRATRGGFVRNVAVALGNSGSEEAVPVLDEALREDTSPLVRIHAAWALGNLASKRAFLCLQSARTREPETPVIDEIDLALAEGGKIRAAHAGT